MPQPLIPLTAHDSLLRVSQVRQRKRERERACVGFCSVLFLSGSGRGGDDDAIAALGARALLFDARGALWRL
jgi:hypothetical protein